MTWRRQLFSWHRDVGFLIAGLTVVYAVSGVAVNHREDWDYNYRTETRQLDIGGPAALLDVSGDEEADAGLTARRRQPELVEKILVAVGRSDRPSKVFWRGRDRLSLLFGKGGRDVIDYSPSTGVAVHDVKSERFLLRAFNALHLNDHHGAWTWFADLFALLLLFLAVSGVIITKGRRGIRGRGGLLFALGVAIPIVALLLFG